MSAETRLSDDASLAWLLQRGRESADEDRASFVDIASVLTLTRHSRVLVVLVFWRDVLSGNSALRSPRTSRTEIGSIHADRERIIGRWIIWHPLRCRILTGAIVAGFSLAIGLAPLAAGLMGLAASSRRMSTELPARRSILWGQWIIGLPSVTLALLVDLPQWWMWLLILPLAPLTQNVIQVFSIVSLQGRRHPYGFVPAHVRLKLSLHGHWAPFTTGVDKAVTDDPARAEPFLAAPEVHLPATVRPMLLIARSVAASRQGSITDSLAFAAQALELAKRVPGRIAGWVSFQAAEVFVKCGRDAEAAAAVEEALASLHPRRDADWYDRALSARIMLRLQDPAAYGELLADIHQLRRRAVRRSNLGIVTQTEVWLLKIMLQVGNELGTLKIARRMITWAKSTEQLGLNADQLVSRHLLLAQILLTDWSTPEAREFEARDRAMAATQVTEESAPYRIIEGLLDFSEDDDEPPEKSSTELAADLAFAALDALRATHHPLADAAARLTIARSLSDHDRADALAHALTSLRIIQKVRYQLPASAWRGNWEALHATAYALTIDLAWAEEDVFLFVELLEGIKSQAVPLPRDLRTLEPIAVLDALILSPVITAGGPSAAATGADPLHFVPAITIDGACWSATSADQQIPLAGTLAEIAPGAWYWTGLIIGDWYCHAVRGPGGDWAIGRVPIEKVRPPLDALLNALPARRRGETTEALIRRRAASPLAKRPLRGADNTDERDLLAAASAVLLPNTLAAALDQATAPDPIRLLVSLPGDLALLPIAGWPIYPDADSARIIERACISHVPSLALLATGGSAQPQTPEYPLDLVILAPNQSGANSEDDRIRYAETPPPAAENAPHRGPLNKATIQNLLRRSAESTAQSKRGSTMYIAGHVLSGSTHEPASGGLVLAEDTRLTLRDLVSSENGAPSFPMPHRVLLSCCGSIGVEATAYVEEEQRHTTEWLGLAAGVIAAGATDVICTLYEIPDMPATARIDHAIASRLVKASSPAESLRNTQLEELARWRRSDPSVIPLLWQAYVHVAAARSDP